MANPGQAEEEEKEVDPLTNSRQEKEDTKNVYKIRLRDCEESK